MWFLSVLFGVPFLLVSIGACVNLAYQPIPVPSPPHPLLEKWDGELVAILSGAELGTNADQIPQKPGASDFLALSLQREHNRMYHVQLLWNPDSGWTARANPNSATLPFDEFIQTKTSANESLFFEIVSNQFQIHTAIESLAKAHNLCGRHVFFSNYSVVISSSRRLLPDCLFFSGSPDFVRFQTLFSLGVPNLFSLDSDGLVLQLSPNANLESTKRRIHHLLTLGKIPILKWSAEEEAQEQMRDLANDRKSPIFFFL